MRSQVSHREDVITTILEMYSDLVDPMQSGNGSGDTGLRLMPATYSASVKHLEELMVRMRIEARSIWWHTSERYIRCSHVTRDVPVKRKGKNGKTVTVMERQVVAVYDRAVRAEKVRKGISWLASSWDERRLGEPCVPEQVLKAAA